MDARTEEKFFFDSWATIELIEANPSVEKYRRAQKTHTALNVFEVCEYFLKKNRGELASPYAVAAWKYCYLVKPMDMVIASRMRRENKRLDMSMTDCIGYVVARRLGIKFLTGDKAFKDMENVEFVS